MTSSPARRAAYEVVLRVFEDEAYADRAFATAAAELDQRDRALAQQIAYGTVQRVRTLDHAIETLGRAAGAQARPARAGCAAARRLPARLPRRVARHAAVNESVELVRGAGLERAVAFTNAVMRRLTVGARELIEAPGGRPPRRR